MVDRISQLFGFGFGFGFGSWAASISQTVYRRPMVPRASRVVMVASASEVCKGVCGYAIAVVARAKAKIEG
jgi:hypothetical protein